MKIGLASDHAGYALKQYVKGYLAEKGLQLSLGTVQTYRKRFELDVPNIS